MLRFLRVFARIPVLGDACSATRASISIPERGAKLASQRVNFWTKPTTNEEPSWANHGFWGKPPQRPLMMIPFIQVPHKSSNHQFPGGTLLGSNYFKCWTCRAGTLLSSSNDNFFFSLAISETALARSILFQLNVSATNETNFVLQLD